MNNWDYKILFRFISNYQFGYPFKGPLTYNDNGRETIVGVVSFSKKRCSEESMENSALLNGSVPVYARVTAKLDWIKKEMEKNYDFCDWKATINKSDSLDYFSIKMENFLRGNFIFNIKSKCNSFKWILYQTNFYDIFSLFVWLNIYLINLLHSHFYSDTLNWSRTIK